MTDRGRWTPRGGDLTLVHQIRGYCAIASTDSNRAFDITFRTPALDDRGIPHVLST